MRRALIVILLLVLPTLAACPSENKTTVIDKTTVSTGVCRTGYQMTVKSSSGAQWRICANSKRHYDSNRIGQPYVSADAS